MNYRHCHLIKRFPEGAVEQFTWLPPPFAVLNKTLRLKINGQWDDGWEVDWVSTEEITEEQLELLASNAHRAFIASITE